MYKNQNMTFNIEPILRRFLPLLPRFLAQRSLTGKTHPLTLFGIHGAVSRHPQRANDGKLGAPSNLVAYV